MRHVDHGDAEPLLQRADFAAQVLAQLRVEIGQRLVEQTDRRLGDERTPKRDALLLAAGQLRRLAAQQRLEAEQGRHLVEPLRHFGFRRAV